jgi:hypothetical protein
MAATQNAAGTRPLISARVDDTLVYDGAGHKIGSIYSFHIERSRGQVEYAVISVGGLLGLGQSYHPIPFGLLEVNQEKGGYTIAFDKSVLDGSPSYRPDTAPEWDADYGRRIASYYADRRS